MNKNMSLFDVGLFDEGGAYEELANHAVTQPSLGELGGLKAEKAKPKIEGYNAQDLWALCLAQLKLAVSEVDFNQWLRPITPAMQGDTLVLSAINPVYIERVQKYYLPTIEEVLRAQTHGQIRLKTQVKSRAPKSVKKKNTEKSACVIEGSTPISELHTFDNFVKGKSNALAYNACRELSLGLGQKRGGVLDNHLLFVYGASGLGKTHLISAVAHCYQQAGLSYCFFDKDSFFKVATTALRLEKTETGRVESMMERIGGADLFIFDDVHMIDVKGSPKVAGLLMQLFSKFTKGNKRLILVSDSSPSRMLNFDERFLSRFAGGLSLPIDSPDMETRIQILQKKAQVKHIQLPKECAIFIAQNIPFDVRGLEGALDQVSAYALTTGDAVSLPLVRQALKDRLALGVSMLSTKSILEVVAEYYELTIKELLGKGRARHIARPRQMAMALTRELTQDSYPEIGQAFGGRDHTTVMHACEVIQTLRQTEVQVDRDYQALITTLRTV